MGVRGRDSQTKLSLESFHYFYAVCFVAGISSVYLFPGAHLFILPGGALACASLLFLRHKNTVLAVCFFLAGAAWIAFVANQRLDAQWPEFRHGEDLELVGEITSISRQDHEQARFLFVSNEMDGRIRVSWYRSKTELQIGQCWKFTLRMRTPRGSVNPGGFDYEGWLFREHIVATAYVKQAKLCEFQPDPGWRNKASEYLSRLLNDHEMSAVVLALALGNRSGFKQSDWDLLRKSGTSHLMAISGLHIGIVAGWVYWLASFLWRLIPVCRKYISLPKAALCASFSAALFYAWISGFGLPAQRAIIMLAVFYIALWTGRRVQAVQLLAIALVAVLVIDPFSIGDAGFWLSFAAVFCIFSLISNRWKMRSKLEALISIQICLGLALLPLTLFWFGEVSGVAPLINLVLVPVFTVLVPLILGSVLWVFVHEPSGILLLEMLADILSYIWVGQSWIVSHVPSSFALSSAGLVIVAIATIGAFLVCAPRGWPAKYVGALLFIPVFLSSPNKDDALRLAILDVGQGLAIVLESADSVLVYDAGPAYQGGFDAGEMVVAPYLKYRGIKEIDVLVQSHGDLDHSGGMPALINAFKVKQTYGLKTSKQCRKGEYWFWDDVKFEFLHPDSDRWEGNNSSCVLKITKGRNSVLLTGDIEALVERKLVKEQSTQVQSQVLVVPHHGSASSSTEPFLTAVNPDIAIYSAGWNNRWGFPKEVVVKRHNDLSVRQYSTADHGAIIFNLKGEEGVPPPILWRKQSRRLWRQ